MQKFFTILISSNFAIISNLSLPMILVYNGKNVLSKVFQSSRNTDANIRDYLRQGSMFG